MFVNSKYFYGNEISEYGQEHGRVDYRTLAKSFDAVLNNEIMGATAEIGYWEPCGTREIYYEDSEGNTYTYDEAQEKIDELNEKIDELAEKITEDSTEEEDVATNSEIDELRAEIETLEDEKSYEIFQWYIVSNRGADILQEAGKVVYYNSTIDVYLWGVTHYGTCWDYVLTNIRCNVDDEEG